MNLHRVFLKMDNFLFSNTNAYYEFTARWHFSGLDCPMAPIFTKFLHLSFSTLIPFSMILQRLFYTFFKRNLKINNAFYEFTTNLNIFLNL